MTRRHSAISALVVLSLLASGSPAQDIEAEDRKDPQDAFFETVDVNVVNIEVFVSDKSGQPVTGLTRDDFEIFDDGRPVQITNFYAVADGRPAVPLTVVERPESQVTEPTPVVARQLPEDQRLHLVVYIDNFNIEPLHRNRIFNRLRQFIHRLDEEDRVMLVSYDRTLNVRHRFTDNPLLVTSALTELETVTGFRSQANRERRDILKAIDNAESSTNVLLRTRQHASSIMNDLRFTLDAMREMIFSLSGLPGRKALLYASDGLPMVPARDLFFTIRQKFQDMSAALESQQFDATRQFQTLANQANSAGVTFYTIDASGLQSLTAGDAENARASSVDGGGPLADSTNLANLQSSIRFIAERTGGTAIVNANDIRRGLSRVEGDFKNYYSLGYSPIRDSDGRFHKVEVKTVRKGLEVRHRAGYRDKPMSQKMSERTASSLRYGYQVNPLGVRLGVGESSRQDDNFVVPFVVQIPLDKVELVPRGTIYEGRVELYFTAMDEEGALSEIQQDKISIEIPPADLETAQTQHYTYELSLLMRPGRHVFGAGIRDEYGASASFVSRSVVAGSG
ncbi:MAG: VWA domain-containing protein [Acidobacteriota bacterium]|nr:VWA domain-containing protein [Acidobacteriota bacterium]